VEAVSTTVDGMKRGGGEKLLWRKKVIKLADEVMLGRKEILLR
jgi:hypothetical protein